MNNHENLWKHTSDHEQSTVVQITCDTVEVAREEQLLEIVKWLIIGT